MTEAVPAGGQVVNLADRRPGAEPASAERIEHIKRWHLRQAISPEHTQVAALHLAITSDAQVHVACVAIEPEHAQALLRQLNQVRAQLQAFVSEHADQVLRGQQVVHLRA